MRLPAVLLACGLLLSGCLAGTEGPAGDEPTLAADLVAEAPPLDFDVVAAVDWWEGIATDYPKHDAYTPMNAALRDRLVSDLEALGLDVEVRRYTGAVGVPVGGPAPSEVGLPETDGTMLYAIVATKPGTELPDHRIGLVSHYDTETMTIHGAYDDASGVAADYHICEALSKLPLRRTLACIFFDGEEQGLLASREYVEDVVLAGDEGYVYDYVLGYDMTGINWPGHPWHLYAMVGQLWHVPGDSDSAEVSALYPFAQDLLNDVLGYPADGVEVLADSHRNSDERRFKEAGVPIIRFAGGLNATDYDQYHQPMDTVEHVYEVTGGRHNFELGFHAIVQASYYTALALDATDYDAIAAAYGFELD